MIYSLPSHYETYERIFFAFGATRDIAQNLSIWWVNKFGVSHQAIIMRNGSSHRYSNYFKDHDTDINQLKMNLYFCFLIDICILKKNYDPVILIRSYRENHSFDSMEGIHHIIDEGTETIVTDDIAFILGMSVEQAKKYISSPIQDEIIIKETSLWINDAHEKLQTIEQFALAMLTSYNELRNEVSNLDNKCNEIIRKSLPLYKLTR